MSFIKRIYYHSMRFKTELIFSSLLMVIFFLFFGALYSEEVVGGIIDLLQQVGIFGGITKEVAGWTFWTALIVGMIMYFIIAVTSINIGSRVIPTRDDDGSEFFMGSNPMDPRRFYLENLFAGLLVIFVIMIPAYIIVVIQTISHDAADSLGNITLAFLAFLALAFFFMSATSAVTASMFQRGLARGVGFGYVFYGFIMELFADSPDLGLQDAAKLSVNYYAAVTSLLMADTYDWNPILIIILISTVFTAIGVWRVKSPHYVEKAGSKERFSIVDATTGYFVKPHSRFSRKFPLIAEQLRKDKKAMFILLLVFLIYFPVLLGTFNSITDEIGQLAATFNTPATAMMIQGNVLDASVLGYGILKFYANAWLWFGIFSLLVATSIPTREVRTNSQDIIYGTNVKPGKLMDRRVIAMIIEFTILMAWTFVLITGISYSFGDEFINDFATAQVQFNYFLVTWILYSAIFIAVVAIAMIPREVAKGRRNGIIFFTISLLIQWMAYSNESIEFIRYLSIFDYYQPIQILYGEVDMLGQILGSLLVLAVSLGFYFLVRKKRYKDSSLY